MITFINIWTNITAVDDGEESRYLKLNLLQQFIPFQNSIEIIVMMNFCEKFKTQILNSTAAKKKV